MQQHVGSGHFPLCRRVFCGAVVL